MKFNKILLLLCLILVGVGFSYAKMLDINQEEAEKHDLYKNKKLTDYHIDRCKSGNSSLLGSTSGSTFVTLVSCVAQGHISGATFKGPYEIDGVDRSGERRCNSTDPNYIGKCGHGVSQNLPETYSAEVLYNIPGNKIAIKGFKNTGSPNVGGTYNTPFLYLENQPEGKIDITINSKRDNYSSQRPDFNIENGWSVLNDNGNMFVELKKVDYLFYLLDFERIELTRNGKNFDSKDELTNYLINSDFFQKLGFDEEQKENSLDYILPTIQDSPNYYLTVLTKESIQNIVNYEFSEEPEKLIRRYFAIYPTLNPVKTSGGLQFPEIIEYDNEYIIKDFGEIYLKNGMLPIWK
ncbi:hypothetical protein [Candidatus Vampirococcus lugosii]|uniref:Uncharacterized protein n=1 Tax=Candidatus Vampirococcus lugosii TaxID=2789015 RepID=A0ABS5QL90_9BACT|nr:hypothetical protein [Candidatus Vampirococcus lugosii]MBS8121970.1 hypothetical protein [Candidatus Vampirococcus lugosii]